MKLRTVMLFAAAGLLCVVPFACSLQDQERFAAEHPALAPTTQLTERVQGAIDPVVDGIQRSAAGVQTIAKDASDLGVPGAGTVALVAGIIGTIAGVYNERRRKTLPLQNAMSQVINSVEAAFPNRTEAQKTTLASMQDQSTKMLVQQIKAA